VPHMFLPFILRNNPNLLDDPFKKTTSYQ
jgi:hypothetical protein